MTLGRPPGALSIPAALLLALLGGSARAEQRLEMQGTAIFGNKESPNVLYVVPWRKPDSIAPMGPPQMSRLDELLSPLDRDVFRRRIQWQQRFQQKE